MSADSDRERTISFPTQEYTSVQHGDARIDGYVTEPAAGVRPDTGLLLLVHGWGNDGSVAYRDDALDFSDRYNLVVTRVEYRHSGRENSKSNPRYEIPYDFSKLQTIDSIRAAVATLALYPDLDRTRLLLWGGSQGAHICAQALVLAPGVWAGAILCCGLYHPHTYAEQSADLYHFDLKHYPGTGFVEYALGPGGTFPAHEVDIRSARRNAHLMPAGVPVAIIHGTVDDNVDIRHAVDLYARLLATGKDARFYAIWRGDHSLKGEHPDADTRARATLTYAADVMASARRPDADVWPTAPTTIPVTSGAYHVRWTPHGPTLDWSPE